MANPFFVIFYVENPLASAVFYEKILGKPPVEAAPTFVIFALENGVRLGLWSRPTVEPKATAPCGGSEIAFSLANVAGVDRTHAAWAAAGATIIQAPVELDFGHSFTAADPDGNRLRVFSPNAETQGIRDRIAQGAEGRR